MLLFKKVYIGIWCKFTRHCKHIHNTYCSNSTCQCKSGYTKLDSKSCIKGFKHTHTFFHPFLHNSPRWIIYIDHYIHSSTPFVFTIYVLKYYSILYTVYIYIYDSMIYIHIFKNEY